MRIRTVLAAAGAAALLAPAVAQARPATTYYVSLGDSLSVGIQPNAAGASVETSQGYANQLFGLERFLDLVIEPADREAVLFVEREPLRPLDRRDARRRGIARPEREELHASALDGRARAIRAVRVSVSEAVGVLDVELRLTQTAQSLERSRLTYGCALPAR